LKSKNRNQVGNIDRIEKVRRYSGATHPNQMIDSEEEEEMNIKEYLYYSFLPPHQSQASG
jgi:hypothetical protein